MRRVDGRILNVTIGHLVKIEYITEDGSWALLPDVNYDCILFKEQLAPIELIQEGIEVEILYTESKIETVNIVINDQAIETMGIVTKVLHDRVSLDVGNGAIEIQRSFIDDTDVRVGHLIRIISYKEIPLRGDVVDTVDKVKQGTKYEILSKITQIEDIQSEKQRTNIDLTPKDARIAQIYDMDVEVCLDEDGELFTVAIGNIFNSRNERIRNFGIGDPCILILSEDAEMQLYITTTNESISIVPTGDLGSRISRVKLWSINDTYFNLHPLLSTSYIDTFTKNVKFYTKLAYGILETVYRTKLATLQDSFFSFLSETTSKPENVRKFRLSFQDLLNLEPLPCHDINTLIMKNQTLLNKTKIKLKNNIMQNLCNAMNMGIIAFKKKGTNIIVKQYLPLKPHQAIPLIHILEKASNEYRIIYFREHLDNDGFNLTGKQISHSAIPQYCYPFYYEIPSNTDARMTCPVCKQLSNSCKRNPRSYHSFQE